jgi:ABC-type branched-subunit amino acid transport system ATPase component
LYIQNHEPALEVGRQPPRQWPGGEQQMLSVARAIRRLKAQGV